MNRARRRARPQDGEYFTRARAIGKGYFSGPYIAANKRYHRAWHCHRTGGDRPGRKAEMTSRKTNMAESQAKQAEKGSYFLAERG